MTSENYTVSCYENTFILVTGIRQSDFLLSLLSYYKNPDKSTSLLFRFGHFDVSISLRDIDTMSNVYNYINTDMYLHAKYIFSQIIYKSNCLLIESRERMPQISIDANNRLPESSRLEYRKYTAMSLYLACITYVIYTFT